MKRLNEARHEEMPPDVSRIPGWTRARTIVDPATAKPPTRRITINLDADIVAIFKADALGGGPPYQVAINQALRRFLIQRERDEKGHAVEAVLSALDHPMVRERICAVVSTRRKPSSR
jgi:uncharacterized protein (DUF4415 family)